MGRFGGPDVLEVVDVEAPPPGPGEVQVTVEAAGVNFWDTEIRSGLGPPGTRFPHVLGTDGAGVVTAVGSDVPADRLGERVVLYPGVTCGSCAACLAGTENRCSAKRYIGVHRPGSYAGAVLVPQANALPYRSMTAASAARVGIPYATAWHLLMRRARVEPGMVVLVVGSGGDVGTAAVQIAALAGARVLAATRGPAKREAALAAGAEAAFDYSESDPWAQAVAATGGVGVDAVVDNSGAATVPRSLGALRVGGMLLTVGGVTGTEIPALDLRQLYVRHLSILGSSNGTRADLQRVLELMAVGRLRPPEPDRFGLSEVRRVHELVASGARSARTVLLPDG
jgi:NADPH:quinone reductase-like Zn-dependent oxidoreductase